MVRGFVMHTLNKGQCKILYNRCYSPELPMKRQGTADEIDEGIFISEADEICKDPLPIEIKNQRQNLLIHVAEKVRDSFQFRISVSGKSVENELSSLLNEDKVPDLELGFCRIADDNFGRDYIVVWLGAINTGFSLICDKDDNRMTAEIVLKILVKYLQKYCSAIGHYQELVNKVDKITVILEQFLPCGQLSIMNHRVVRQLEKDLEMKIKTMN